MTDVVLKTTHYSVLPVFKDVLAALCRQQCYGGKTNLDIVICSWHKLKIVLVLPARKLVFLHGITYETSLPEMQKESNNIYFYKVKS